MFNLQCGMEGILSSRVFHCSNTCPRDMELLKQQFDVSQHRQLENSMKLETRNVSFQPQQHSSEKTYENPIIEALGIPQFQHQRIRALHGDHQPLYIAPPPPHFFPSFPNQTASTYTLPEQ